MSRIAIDRSAYSVFTFVFVVGIALACGSSFEGPAVRISRDYWRWIAPVAIPLAAVVAWGLQGALFGSWCKPRYAKEERQMRRGESLLMGAGAAVVLVTLASVTFANVANQVVGEAFVATFDVVAKHIKRGKHTCYGITIVNVRDSHDQFEMCVPGAEYDRTALGQVLRVNGRRSKYVEQIVSYAIEQ